MGRIGVWTSLLNDLHADAERDFARAIERLGFHALWFNEGPASREALSHSALLLAWTERLVVAPGIANIWARDVFAAVNGARLLADASSGRFVLGLGVSHAPAVAARGASYTNPYQHMVDYLDGMANVAFPDQAEPAPVVLAALGPRMLRLAAERTAGAHPYFVPVEHTRRARQVLGQAPLLAVEQAVVLETDAARARDVARRHTARYLRLPNYVNNLRRLGFGDTDLHEAGSDALVDAVVAWGDEQTVAARVRAHLDAGADHVCIQALTAEPDPRATLAQLERLASADLVSWT